MKLRRFLYRWQKISNLRPHFNPGKLGIVGKLFEKENQRYKVRLGETKSSHPTGRLKSRGRTKNCEFVASRPKISNLLVFRPLIFYLGQFGH